uniref:receptor protein serine/threonine kinase n=1 Tax=Astyanax mexicanus TaxID=7994 RepID=W5LRC2_ASTMX
MFSVVLWFTGLFSACISALPVAPERRCAFLASPRNTEKAQRAGNISGTVQHCARTYCCMGIFRLEHGGPTPDLLGCSITETSCPEASCRASAHRQNYLSCVCSSDFCNINITLNNQAKQTQPSHTSDVLSASLFVIPGGALVILIFLLTVLGGKRLVRVVARGHFADVRQGFFKGSSVALKVFPESNRQEFSKEKNVYLLPFMTHCGIVHCLGVGRMGREFVLILELATQGSLNTFLSRTVSDWNSTLRLAQTVSQGLAYLHTELNKNGACKPAIAHGDLSSSNVLVKADGSCALCDFGCSVVLQGFRNCPGIQDHSGETEVSSFFNNLQAIQLSSIL